MCVRISYTVNWHRSQRKPPGLRIELEANAPCETWDTKGAPAVPVAYFAGYDGGSVAAEGQDNDDQRLSKAVK